MLMGGKLSPALESGPCSALTGGEPVFAPEGETMS